MQTLHLPLLNKRELAENTFEFSFPRPKDFFYDAGQYISLSVEKPEIAGPGGTMRELSLVSAPYEETLDLALRFRESKAKQQFANLQTGDYAFIQGPFGSFHLERTTSPLVFLAGGIGIAPLLSMLKDNLHNKRKNDIVIFFSNRRQTDMAYLPELQQLVKNHPTVSLIPTLTAEEATDRIFESGYITSVMIKRHVPNYKRAYYYISGPVRFVGGMWEILETLKIPERNIHGEEFTGY